MAPRMVEVRPDGTRRQPELTGDLLVRPAFEVVQQYHLALGLGELRQRREKPSAKLAALHLQGGGHSSGHLVLLQRLGGPDRVMPNQITGPVADDLEQPAAELRRVPAAVDLLDRRDKPSWQASSASASLRVTARAMARQARKYRPRSRSAARASPARTPATSAASVSSIFHSLTRETEKVLNWWHE